MAVINLLARDFRFEVSSDNVTWVRPKGLNDLNASIDPNLEDANNYDTDGWGSQEITLQNWSVSVGMHRKSDASVEDTGQSLIRGCMGKFGDAARLYVRWYRTDGLTEAWSGRALVSVTQSNTSTTDIAAWQVTFTGDGVLTAITNPFTSSAVPVITTVSPNSGPLAGGNQTTITGQFFTGVTGATGVKFGTNNATSYVVVSDYKIVAVVPAGTAGAKDVVVTNSAGASTTGTGDYTYV